MHIIKISYFHASAWIDRHQLFNDRYACMPCTCKAYIKFIKWAKHQLNELNYFNEMIKLTCIPNNLKKKTLPSCTKKIIGET